MPPFLRGSLLAVYMFHRTKDLLDVNDYLPNKINALADVLVQAKGGDGAPRDEFVRAPYAAVVAQEIHPSNIHGALIHGHLHSLRRVKKQRSGLVPPWQLETTTCCVRC